MSEKKRKFWIRFMAILLVVLMVGSVAYAALAMLLA